MNPTQVRVINPVLTSVVQGYVHPNRIGEKLFPRVNVDASGGQVITFGKESFQLFNSQRAPGSATKRVQYGYQGAPFALLNHSLEGVLPDEYRRDALAVPGIDLGREIVQGVMDAMTLRLEFEQAQVALNPANYDANHQVVLNGMDKWSHQAMLPAKQIREFREVIRTEIGVRPNTLALSVRAFNALVENPSIVERFRYTSHESITAEMIAGLLELEQVVVGEAIYVNQAEQMVDIWGNNAVLAYVPTNSSGFQQPSFAYTYVMRGHPVAVNPYRDNNTKSWIYPVDYERTAVLTGMIAGFLIQTPA